MENTLAGSVHENYDHLLHFDVRIAAETNVRIVHNLIAPPGVRFKDLRKVYSQIHGEQPWPRPQLSMHHSARSHLWTHTPSTIS